MRRYWKLVFARLLLAGVVSLTAGFVQGQSGAAQTAPQKEKSVKPGINEQWKSPNVEPLIGTLEAESREIYHAREKLAALVAPRPGAVVADVGAGSGFMAELFARMVGPQGKVFAVDINPKLLEHIERNARARGLANLQIVLGQEDSIGLPANSVDLVFICDTYHHFEYPKSSMQSIYRALRPGGEIVLVEFHRVRGKSAEWMFEHVRAGQDVFTQEIIDAGFEVVQIETAPFLTENYVVRFRKVEKVAARQLLLVRPGLRPAAFSLQARPLRRSRKG
jgi:precorrin-6B methylase 2